jgi:hypothetical protein
MKINSRKIKLAQTFLNLLKKELQKVKTKETLTLEMYANGREHGYHLSLLVYGNKGGVEKWGCSFSENRNSDDLVVYTGIGILHCFDMAGNVPSDHVYANRQFFSSTDSGRKDALAFIVDSLKDFLPKEKEVVHA